MGKRIELAIEEKVWLVEEYIAGRMRGREAARRAGVGSSTMHSWISRYRAEGIEALQQDGNQKKREYTQDTRRKVVEEYLSGKGSSMSIAEKYKIRSGNLVLDWVKEYHRHNGKEAEGDVMTKRRYTLEERVQAVKAHLENGAACLALHVSRAGYYRWLSDRVSARAAGNRRIAEMVKEIHTQSPDKGYRHIRDDLERYFDTPVNDKRVLRICRSLRIKSTIKYASHGCTKRPSDQQHTAENLLGRQFHADRPNEKWLTDVTEFKYYVGPVLHKIYLSAILDLCDRKIVTFVIRNTNDSALVYDTFDQAVTANPEAHPLFHSDRGIQYTTQVFHNKLTAAGMVQSMSRIGKCIDNGPMEGLWGILKRERYYGRRFTNREELVQMIQEYIVYYNSRRLQRGLGVLTPLEKHELCIAA